MGGNGKGDYRGYNYGGPGDDRSTPSPGLNDDRGRGRYGGPDRGGRDRSYNRDQGPYSRNTSRDEGRSSGKGGKDAYRYDDRGRDRRDDRGYASGSRRDDHRRDFRDNGSRGPPGGKKGGKKGKGKGKGKGRPRPVFVKPDDVMDDVLFQFDDPEDVLAQGNKCTVGKWELLASFNWFDEEGDIDTPGRNLDKCETTPKIIVPGVPPIYDNHKRPGQLERDKNQYCDENGFRQPEYPLDSVFVASAAAGKNPLQEADFITDRNNLRKMLQWLRGDRDEPFLIRVDAVKYGEDDESVCILLTRSELQPPVRQQDSQFGGGGFGHSFEAAVTRLLHDDEKITSFRRIVKVPIGDLNVLCRSEVDAVEMNMRKTDVDVADLSFATKEGTTSKIEVCSKGVNISEKEHEVIEMKTKRADKSYEFDWTSTYFQMAIAGVTKLVIGWHKFGAISHTNEYSLDKVREEAQNHSEKRKQESDETKLWGALNLILSQVRDVTLDHPDQKCCVWFSGTKGDPLEIRERNSYSRVPDSVGLHSEYAAQDRLTKAQASSAAASSSQAPPEVPNEATEPSEDPPTDQPTMNTDATADSATGETDKQTTTQESA